jgi:transcriptional regulator with XRE-family HTH domain
MEIGKKLRELRQSKHLSQGDIEQKAAPLRCYTSRVENGSTIPTIETLEKYARAMQIPLYRFFTAGEAVNAPKLPAANLFSAEGQPAWGFAAKHQPQLRPFAKAFKRTNYRRQKLLVDLAQEMARRRAKS